MFSALKHEGQRLYDLARAGVEVERPSREVAVHQLTLTGWGPPTLTIEAECGRGFYMRTLAHDIGQALGCGAHLSALTRVRAGSFHLDESIDLKALEARAEEGAWRDMLLPPDAAVADLETLKVEPAAERHLRNGQSVSLRSVAMYAEHAEQRRVYSINGRFLAVARFNRAQDHWQPDKVFDLPQPSPLAPGTDS
jgi:tRNA pseudouridine55 synthase